MEDNRQTIRQVVPVRPESKDKASVDESHTRKIKTMREVDLIPPAILDEMKIIHPAMRNRNVLNMFRELRTKLVFDAGKENFSILVTSVSPGGGASFVARNLAAAIALDQMKTALLVDCNLYNPTLRKVFGIDKVFGIEAELGLTDYLADDTIDVDEIIYASGIPRLRIITAGNYCESGTEHFSSTKMKRFMDEVVKRYPDRYIILDAPSLATAADTHILAELCDRSLLVVPYGEVVPGEVEAAVDSLSKTHFAGIVFNNN